jgi:hypothetical protein
MTHVRRDWNVPVPEDTRYFMVNTLPGASSYAIGFLHPSELLIFKRLPSYQTNSRPTARWWSATCHLAAECSPALSPSPCVESDCAVTTC